MTSKLNSVLLTGANRRIGFELLKKILIKFRPTVAFATYRDVSKPQELVELAETHKNLYLIQMDIKSCKNHADMASLIESRTGDAGLNLLLNNTEISDNARLGNITLEKLRSNMEVNCFSPILLTQALLPQLEKASSYAESSQMGINRAAIVNFSSILGSIGRNDFGAMYPFRCSKSALHSATKSMSVDLKSKKILALAIHPGRVDMTRMTGKSHVPLTIDQSVDGIIQVLTELNESHNGKFIDWEGQEVEW